MFNSVNVKVSYNLLTGKIKPDQLALHRKSTAKGSVWEVIDTTSEEGKRVIENTKNVLFSGKDVEDILKASANDKEIPEHLLLSNVELKELGKDPVFRKFSQIVPGMETSKHRATREKVEKAIKRVITHGKIIGKGIAKIEGEGGFWRIVAPHYWLAEVVMRDESLPQPDAMKFAEIWKDDDTKLSFFEWKKEMEESWKTSGTDKDFLPWLAETSFRKREVNAWKKSNPGIEFSEEKFDEWKKGQSLPPFGEPRWMLEEMWKEDEKDKDAADKQSFDEWIEKNLEGRVKFWADFPKETGGILSPTLSEEQPFDKLDKIVFEYNRTGSPLKLEVYVAKALWLEEDHADTSEEAFTAHLDQSQFNYEKLKGKTTQSTVEDWKVEREEKLKEKWKGTQLPLSFEEWKRQQVPDPINPIPFIRLDEEERRVYKTECVEGKLFRNDSPFDTSFESTLHSGEGHAIFVIGPDDDLYCGSHIGQLFHHSSFLGDSAVRGAGEVTTDSEGNITAISAKSGHYRPTHNENKQMLEWFENKGVDLSGIDFIYFNSDGTDSDPVNAKLYMETF